MGRILIPLLVLCLTGVMMAPSVVVLQFRLDQERIAKELCVQRDRMEGMRDCHGECQLTKRLKALEQEADAGFPLERITQRWEPVSAMEMSADAPEAAGLAFTLCRHDAGILEGILVNPEPVPWA